jgi:hypothetical protein
MTYDFAKYGISYRDYFPIPIWSMHDRDYVRVVGKSYRSVPKTLPIHWGLKNNFEMALYRTDPYHAIPCIMHVYRTVPYRNQNQYGIFARIMAKQLLTLWYDTVPYGTGAGRMWGHVVPYGTCARVDIFCGGSWSQAHAQFRHQIIL